MRRDSILIAQVGRTVGLKGDLKLNLFTDFPEQFKKGSRFDSSYGELEVLSFDKNRKLIKFVGFETLESAKRLTNTKIFSSKDATKESITLKKGQYFWFDIIGCRVFEGDKILGEVKEIQRVLDTDYLSIKTDKSLVEQSMPKAFLIPYIDRYILLVDIENKKILVKDAFDILGAS